MSVLEMPASRRMVFLLCAGVYGSLYAQVIYPASPAWAVVDGQRVDLSAFRVTAEEASRYLRGTRLESGTRSYSAKEVEAAARHMWCQQAGGVVEKQAKISIAKKLGVTVSDAEVKAEFLAEVSRPESQARAQFHRQRAASLQQAFADVFTQNKPADEVWAAHLKQSGLPLVLWRHYVSTMTDASARQALIEDDLMVARSYAQETPWVGFGDIVLARKMEARGDQEIAHEDPVFAQYLKSTGAGDLRAGKTLRLVGAATEHMEYIRRKRAEWQDQQLRALTVLTSEPSVGETCGIWWLIPRQRTTRP